jgi:chromatin remodeling complex protein RSC6
MVFSFLKRKKKRTTRKKTSRGKTTRKKKVKRKTVRRSVRRSTARRKTSRRSTRKRSKRKGKPFGGYEIVPDEHLAKIIGRKALSPSQMTKNVWSYIKRKRLARR